MTKEQLPENEISTDSDDCVEKTHLGLKLKNQRELLNMTQADAASKLNLDVSYIDAIEKEDFSEISSTSYVYGYIRSYAKLLQLPEEEVLDMYKQGISEEHQLLPDYMGNKMTYINSSASSKYWGLLIVIIVCLLFGTWWFIRQ